jgi:hypothetical protein
LLEKEKQELKGSFEDERLSSRISGGGLTYLLLRLYDSIRSQPQEKSNPCNVQFIPQISACFASTA